MLYFGRLASLQYTPLMHKCIETQVIHMFTLLSFMLFIDDLFYAEFCLTILGLCHIIQVGVNQNLRPLFFPCENFVSYLNTS